MRCGASQNQLTPASGARQRCIGRPHRELAPLGGLSKSKRRREAHLRPEPGWMGGRHGLPPIAVMARRRARRPSSRPTRMRCSSTMRARPRSATGCTGPWAAPDAQRHGRARARGPRPCRRDDLPGLPPARFFAPLHGALRWGQRRLAGAFPPNEGLVLRCWDRATQLDPKAELSDTIVIAAPDKAPCGRLAKGSPRPRPWPSCAAERPGGRRPRRRSGRPCRGPSGASSHRCFRSVPARWRRSRARCRRRHRGRRS